MLILHGENIVSSRKRLSGVVESFKASGGEVVRLEGDKTGLSGLKQALESASLFGHDRLVVVEGIFSSPPSKTKKGVLGYLKKEMPENLVIWEGKTIDGRSLALFTQAKIEKFTLPSIIFKFLDSLAPNNKKTSLVLLHQCLNQDTPEMVFYMLARQIRLLIIAADLGEKGLANLPRWQRIKLISQAKRFGLEKLLTIHSWLLEIDLGQKTGRAHFSLSSLLDLLVVSL